VADKDTRYELDARGDPLTFTDGIRSEGASASHASEPAEDPDTTRAPRSGKAPPHVPVPENADTAQSPEAQSAHEAVAVPEEHWHSVMAEALAQPEPTEPAPDEAVLQQSTPRENTDFVTEPASADETTPAFQAGQHGLVDHGDTAAHDDHAKSFTDAVEGLFRPPATGPGDETHLITIGRRLDPSLRIPRPVAPDIEPRFDLYAEPQDSKKTHWKTRLYTVARYAGLALAAYLALVVVLIVLFRFVNPPGSMLMLKQLLTGTSIDRTWASFENISPALVRAVVVSEDGRFCEHSGIDTAAIKEAIDRASGGAPRGASTISMQVTKNLFLWNAKSYVRKVIEIPLTLIMELLWPKKRVLEVYLNIAEWGPGVFGAEAAARHHFNKSAARLNEREAALLAAVLPNPIARDAGAPGSQTSRKARVIQSRVKAYGAVASCVAGAAPAQPSTAAPRSTLRKPQPLRAQPRKKPVDEWSPTLNFGN
jgi:monofunctional biosynthetic peptidoglycan transglycosylase